MLKNNHIITVKYDEMRKYVRMIEKGFNVKSVSVFWLNDELYATILYQ